MIKTQWKVAAVIFDMDGVITNTMPDHFRAWNKVFSTYGLHMTHMDVYKREGQKGLQSVKEIFAERKIPFHLAQARKILQEKEKLFKAIVKRRFVPGSRRLLHDLHRKGIRLALVTGTARHELRRILPHHLTILFEVIVTGSDVRHGKPHPEPFLKALKKLGLNSSHAVVIENASFGIRAAKAAGLKCLAVETSLPREFLKEADEIFSSIKELSRHVKFQRMIQK